MPRPANLQNSHQNGGRVFAIFVADPKTVRLCKLYRGTLGPGVGLRRRHTTRWAAWRGAVNPAPRQLSETDIWDTMTYENPRRASYEPVVSNVGFETKWAATPWGSKSPTPTTVPLLGSVATQAVWNLLGSRRRASPRSRVTDSPTGTPIWKGNANVLSLSNRHAGRARNRQVPLR